MTQRIPEIEAWVRALARETYGITESESADLHATVAAQLATERSCPCLFGSPCRDQCTCLNPLSSSGCAHCARYGNPEQQRAAARAIAAAIREARHA